MLGPSCTWYLLCSPLCDKSIACTAKSDAVKMSQAAAAAVQKEVPCVDVLINNLGVLGSLERSSEA